jgi:hypothetical protein
LVARQAFGSNNPEILKLIFGFNPDYLLHRIPEDRVATTIKILLENKSIDILNYYKCALCLAFYYNDLQTLELLLSDERLDKITRDDLVTECFTEKYYKYDIVYKETLVLFDKHNVKLSAGKSILLESLLEIVFDNKDYELFKSYLNDKNCDPLVINNYLMRYACELGNIDLVKRLLEDGVQPIKYADNSYYSDLWIDRAFRGEYYEIFKLLLNDKSCSCKDFGLYVRPALAYSHFPPNNKDADVDYYKHIAVLLLTKERIISSINEDLLQKAVEWFNKYYDWIEKHHCSKFQILKQKLYAVDAKHP